MPERFLTPRLAAAGVTLVFAVLLLVTVAAALHWPIDDPASTDPSTPVTSELGGTSTRTAPSCPSTSSPPSTRGEVRVASASAVAAATANTAFTTGKPMRPPPPGVSVRVARVRSAGRARTGAARHWRAGHAASCTASIASRTESAARWLFFGSITYLPLLWAAMILNH